MNFLVVRNGRGRLMIGKDPEKNHLPLNRQRSKLGPLMIRNGRIAMKLRHLCNHQIGVTTVQSVFKGSSLFGDDSILAILTNIKTEGGISWESLSVHPCEHWALSIDVIVDFNR